MKTYFKLCLILFCAVAFAHALAQTPAGQVAGRIAQKMQDSLTLSQDQRNAIYQINLQLIQQKAQMRKRYKSPDSLKLSLQQIEDTRDQLYKPVLVTEEKFRLYKKAKPRLVSAN